MTKQDQKRALRQTMRRLESQLSPRYKAQSSQKICAHLLAMPEYQASSMIVCFVGTAHEIDTRPILTHALESGKRVCVPLCTAPGIMELREIASLTDLSPGAYGIPEPDAARCPAVDTDEVDFAVLPCLCCNHQGHRLGQGGGYYDRFLSHYRGGSVLLCREKLLRQEIPLEPHDYPVPWVLTETCLYEDGMPERLG